MSSYAGKSKRREIIHPIEILTVIEPTSDPKRLGHSHKKRRADDSSSDDEDYDWKDWTIQLRNPRLGGKYVQPELDLPYIEKVVFILHESFSPNKRVVKSPPFQVSETGWGSFEVFIDIYFKDANMKRQRIGHLLEIHQTRYTETYDLRFISPSPEFISMLETHGNHSRKSSKRNSDSEESDGVDSDDSVYSRNESKKKKISNGKPKTNGDSNGMRHRDRKQSAETKSKSLILQSSRKKSDFTAKKKDSPSLRHALLHHEKSHSRESSPMTPLSELQRLRGDFHTFSPNRPQPPPPPPLPPIRPSRRHDGTDDDTKLQLYQKLNKLKSKDVMVEIARVVKRFRVSHHELHMLENQDDQFFEFDVQTLPRECISQIRAILTS